MKKMFIITALFSFLFADTACTTKEIVLNYDNPVSVDTEFVSTAFVGDPLEASIRLVPKDGTYPVNYNLTHVVEEGEGVYKLDGNLFTATDVHTFSNAEEIIINVSYEGATEGVHKSKWIVRNDFEQEFYTFLEFELKKNPEPAPNETPTAIDDSFTTKQEVALLLDVLANDTDKEKDTLTITEVTTTENGTAIIEDGKIRYTPNDGYIGEDTITYSISDGENTATGSVLITVVEKTAENLAPVANDDTIEVEINTPTTITVLDNDNDPEGMDLQLVAVTTPTNGTATISGLIINYKPNQDFEGSDTFNYTVKDSEGLESSATITITVINSNPNLAPVAVNDAIETPFETAVTIDVLVNDTDNENDEITLLSVSNSVNGIATIENGKIVYTPNKDFSGTDTFTYKIKDAIDNEAEGSITVTILEKENIAPTAVNDNATTVEEKEITIDVLSNDSDQDSNDILSIKSITQPSNGATTVNGNSIIYMPNMGFVGTDTFSYTIDDGRGGESTATVNITVDGQIYDLVSKEFEQWLVDERYDSDREVNGKISKKDADFVEKFVIEGITIKDFSDIKYFANLKNLELRFINELVDVDLSALKKLETVWVQECYDIATVNVNDNPSLTKFEVDGSTNYFNFEAMNSPELNYLGIYYTNLANIDLRNNTKLTALLIIGSSLNSIDVSSLTNLERLELFQNDKINTLDLSNNTKLKLLQASSTPLALLDLSNNLQLTEVDLESTNLKAIDLTNQKNLENVDVGRNDNLEFVNFKNGAAMLPSVFFANKSPKLLCIQVNNKFEFTEQILNNPNYRFEDYTDVSENCNP